jgi:hypothetical protein
VRGGDEHNKGHSIDGEGGTTDNGDSGGCGWKWKGGRHSERRERTAMITRRKEGRGRGGGDDTPMDNNDEDDDDDDDNDNDDDDNNDDNDNGDDDGDGNRDNNNSTIKQCMGVRKRRKMVAAMDDGQRQKWQLLRRNSAWGIKEEECMTIDNSRLHDG